jgi:hypothetical protein
MKYCFECQKPGDDLIAHHVVPRSRGGTKTLFLCQECHDKAHHYDNPRNISVSSLIREGLARAKERGVRFGRPETLPLRYDEVMGLKNKGMGIRAIGRVLSMPPASVCKIVHMKDLVPA